MDIGGNDHRRQQTGDESRTYTMNNAGHLSP
jgi:very-short-patch-repair endonuclease